MKKFLASLAPLALASAAFAEGGTDLTPAAVTSLYSDASATISANIPLIAGLLAVGFGLVIAFWAYGKIKKGVNKAG